MVETLFGILAIVVIIAFVLIVIYGSALILTEHFWIGIFLLFFISPIFFIWALIRGIIGKK
jgi:hypothetical protein